MPSERPRHQHVQPPKSQPYPPGEGTVAWMTNSGYIAIPESEAQMRREAMSAQLGVGELYMRIGVLEKRVEELTEYLAAQAAENAMRNRKPRKF